MSRDLNYRVWDKKKKEYSDSAFSLDQYGILYIQDQDSYWEEASEDRYIIEFSTGLEDRNGKEISKGDIVKVVLFTRNGDKGRYKKDGVEEIGYIGFEDGSFKICFAKNKFGEPTSYLRLDDLHWETYGEVLGKATWYKYDPEVIGNIHENPELLESTVSNDK